MQIIIQKEECFSDVCYGAESIGSAVPTMHFVKFARKVWTHVE